jgi:thioredoxin-like negative regulator of GroEL
MPEGTDTQQPSATPGAATPATVAAKAATPAETAPTPADEPLGDGGKKALEAEREARKELERQLGQIKEGLAQVFGKQEGKATADDVLANLSSQVEDMKRDALVYRLAATHKITEQDDIDLLRSAKDEDAMTRLAARLASQAEDASRPGTPKPDLSQGTTGREHMALNGDPLEQSLRSALGIK